MAGVNRFVGGLTESGGFNFDVIVSAETEHGFCSVFAYKNTIYHRKLIQSTPQFHEFRGNFRQNRYQTLRLCLAAYVILHTAAILLYHDYSLFC